MKTFIRAVEVWLPDAGHTLLEWGGGLYPDAPRFGAVSRAMCFGRAEGLPGQAWELGRPLVLKRFEGSYFLRTRAAAAEGLTCGIALPYFHGERPADVPFHPMTTTKLYINRESAKQCGIELNEDLLGEAHQVFER